MMLRRRVAGGVLVTLLIAGVGTCVCYKRDLRSARRAATADSRIIQSACGPIEYAERGSGAPVVSIHGTGGGWDQGLFIARGLVDRGFRVIAPSRYGYLKTVMPENPSPQSEAKMLACFMDAMHIKRASVIAASAGATPALQLALQYPERISSMVLLVPAVGGILPHDTVDLVSPVIMNVVLRSDFPYWLAMKIWPRSMLTIVAVPSSLVPQLSDSARADLDEAIRMILPSASWKRCRDLARGCGVHGESHQSPVSLSPAFCRFPL